MTREPAYLKCRIICFLQLGSVMKYYIPSFPDLTKKAIISNATHKVPMECSFLTPPMALDGIGLRESDERRRAGMDADAAPDMRQNSLRSSNGI